MLQALEKLVRQVSVVIPTYNRRSLLMEAIGSALSSTVLELVIVDDGSDDGTAEYLADLGRQAPELLRLVTLTHGGTPGRARNRGVAAARGRYIAFLDADDLWRPHKLARQLQEHARPEAPVLSHTRETWLRNGRVVSQAGQKHGTSGDVFADSLHKCIIGPSTVVLERAVFQELDGFREDLEIAEDYELWLRLVHRYSVAYVNEELTVKRAGHGDQLSERYGAIEYFRIQALQDLVDRGFFDEHPEHAAAARRALSRKCRIYAQGCAKRDRFQEAQDYERRARYYTPGGGTGRHDS